MPETVAKQSKVLKEMLDTCPKTGCKSDELSNEVEKEEVPLPAIHSEHLKLVVRLVKVRFCRPQYWYFIGSSVSDCCWQS